MVASETTHHVKPHHYSSDERSLPVRRRLEYLERRNLGLDLTLILQLFPHLVELLGGHCTMFLALPGVKSLEDSFCFVEPAFLHEPARRVRKPVGAGQHDQRRSSLKCKRESPRKARRGASSRDEIDPESDPGAEPIPNSKHDAMHGDHEPTAFRCRHLCLVPGSRHQ